MKIAFVFPPMWTPHSDGSLQIWNDQVTRRLSETCDVTVYSGKFSSEPTSFVGGVRYRRFSTRWDTRLVNALRRIRSRLGIEGPLFASDLWYLGYYVKVALDLGGKSCDVAHVYYYPQFAALIKTLNPGLRVILHMHGEWLTQVKFKNLAARLRKLDLVISCSEFITQATRRMFPQISTRCETVPMGVSPQTFEPGAETSQPDKSAGRRLLYVGRISPEKGVHVLLDAFESIVQRFPKATLTIVGPEWIAPREDITDLSLPKEVIASLAPFYNGHYLLQLKEKLSPEAAQRVNFVGAVPYRDVATFYQHVDLYVCPSLYESFGVSILEAMAAGLPIVATRVGAVPQLMSDGRSGLIVETANPKAIADAVISLFTNGTRHEARCSAARDDVVAQFSWEAICSTLGEMYRGVSHTNAHTLEHRGSVRVSTR